VISWSSEHEGLRLWVGYDRWPSRARREEYEHRNIAFSIQDTKKRVIAEGKFVEWEFNYPPENWVEDNSRAGVPRMNWFLDWADGWSQSSYEAAEIVRTYWPDKNDDSPFDFGNVVIFDRLEINAKTKLQSVAVWVLVTELISRQFLKPGDGKRNGAAIFLIKPFPLEYEGNITKVNGAAFERRRAAMIRHYGARLNAELLGDDSDRWMWIDTHCPIKPRKAKRRRADRKPRHECYLPTRI
jgi:hypothetical protein